MTCPPSWPKPTSLLTASILSTTQNFCFWKLATFSLSYIIKQNKVILEKKLCLHPHWPPCNSMTVLNILIMSLLSHHLGGLRAARCLYHFSASSPVAPGRHGYIPLWKFPSAPIGQPSHSSGFFRPQNSLTFLILSNVRLVSALHWY